MMMMMIIHGNVRKRDYRNGFTWTLAKLKTLLDFAEVYFLVKFCRQEDFLTSARQYRQPTCRDCCMPCVCVCVCVLDCRPGARRWRKCDNRVRARVDGRHCRAALRRHSQSARRHPVAARRRRPDGCTWQSLPTQVLRRAGYRRRPVGWRWTVHVPRGRRIRRRPVETLRCASYWYDKPSNVNDCNFAKS